jgi:hypothetical protein
VFKLPCQVIEDRFVRVHDERNAMAKHSSLFEYVAIQIIQWSLHTLDPSVVKIFYSRKVCELFYLFRRYRYGAALLGDTSYEYFVEVTRIWMLLFL